MASRVNATTLSPEEAWTLWRSIYVPKIYYPSKVTAFIHEDWTLATQKFVAAIIRPMGFNSHTARPIIYGSRMYGGVGLVPGASKQGSEGLAHFLTHIQCRSRLGILMLNTLSQLQLLSGQRSGLLSHPVPLPKGKVRKGSNVYRWHHLGRGWLLSLPFSL